MVRNNNALKGLNDEEVRASREKYGSNEYTKAKKKSFLRRLLDSFSDPIIRILLLAMIVNLIFTIRNINWSETAGIVIAVAISTFVSAISEYGSEKAFEKLKEESKNISANVVRNGKPQRIGGEELVVGDIVLLGEGEKIAADGVILQGSLKIDQSAVSGESEPVQKSPSSRQGTETDRLYAGTLIVEGEGKMMVTAVGDNSVYGKIAGEIQTESGESPLKNRLNKLAGTISKIGYAAAALVALTYLFNVFVIDSGYNVAEILMKVRNLRFVAMRLIKAVTIAMTVIVVAVPEGLPMMITVVLSSNMKKMMRDQVLVRKMVGIETAGCMNILFTDKTGTLTEGRPVCGELVFGNGDRFSRQSVFDSKILRKLQCSVFLNSGCTMRDGEPVGGNPTEQALCRFFKQPDTLPQIKNKLPFNSKNKYSAVQTDEAAQNVYIKGAPEKILPYCKYCYDKQGNRTAFYPEKMQKLVKKLSSNASRILALATADSFRDPSAADGMTFLCIAVLSDGLRKTAKKAVKDLQNAGIQTVMITGDSKETAVSIAKECGILNTQRNLVLTGKELAETDDQTLMQNLDRLAVIARAMPSDKSRLIDVSRKKGLVSGMTGDGVNDAPALKKADVGFSMGSGTDIAKEASEVILLDNDLSSVVNAVLYGRTVFKSIRKFITFQLIMNLCAVGVSFFGQLMGIDSPVTVIQMLWVNIIMDTLGGLAFAGEYPLRFYLKEKPISREEPILRKSTLFQILLMGGYGTALCTFFLSNAEIRQLFNYENNNLPMLTAFFALFIFTGIVICFTARSERVNILAGLGKNKAFIAIMALILTIQLLMLYFGGSLFRCVGLSKNALLLVVVLSLTVVPVDFVRRLLFKGLFKEKRKRIPDFVPNADVPLRTANQTDFPAGR